MMPRRLPTARRVVVAAVLFSIGFVPRASAQSPALPGRLAVSATLGLFRPIDSAMTDVYGSRLTPVTGHLDVRIVPDVWLFGGVKWMSADGHAVVVGTPQGDETSPTSLSVTTLRVGALVGRDFGPRWTLAGGAGVAIARYEETWPEADMQFNNQSSGFLLLAEVRYALRMRWAVIGRAEYSSVRANVPDGSSVVNLGGVDASAGVRFVF